MAASSLSAFQAFAAVMGGLVILVAGGESLVAGATRLAKRLGMKPLIIGLTVVAFGTSIPELFVSLTASLQGYPDIMIGNVVGSNIANVGLILGFCALLAPLKLTIHEVWIELLLVSCGSILLMFCSGYGFFPRAIGLLFMVTLISYTILTSFNSLNGKNTQHPTNKQEDQKKNMPLAFMLGLIILGLFLLAGGSNLFIKGAVDLARYFKISELVIGLTLAAIGTSLPELASSIAALRHKESGLLIGNIIGSNMFNLFMVLGLTGLIKPFSLSPDLLHRDLPVMLFFTLVLIPILYKNGGTKRHHGLLFLGAYCIYFYNLL